MTPGQRLLERHRSQQKEAKREARRAEYESALDAEANGLLRDLGLLLAGANPLFVPCHLASKKPSVKYAELTHDNVDKFWLNELRLAGIGERNLAVKLGPISGDLCTIDLDRDELIEPCLALNPRLGETLRTRGLKGCQFWFKVEGDIRK